MTTFQAICYAALNGFTEFLPVSPQAHRILLSWLTGWREPSGVLLGAFSASSALALLLYFLHDWLSMLSSLLQVVIYRKKPMTLDERMPLFVATTCALMALGWFELHDLIERQLDTSPARVAATMAGFGVILWLCDHFGRKLKKVYDWNFLDAGLVGLLGIAALIPGFGRTSVTLAASESRGFTREAAAKYTFYVALPVLAANAATSLGKLSFHAGAPMEDVSWLTFGVSAVVSFLASLLAITAFMRQIPKTGLTQYAVWRWLAGAAVLGLAWWRG